MTTRAFWMAARGRRLASMMALAATLAACGGGGGGEAPAPGPAPGPAPAPSPAPTPAPGPAPSPGPAPAPSPAPTPAPAPVPVGISLLVGDEGGPGFADGQGRVARFFNPSALALDTAGRLIVADAGNGRIRLVTPEGATTTFAESAGPLGDVAAGPGGTVYAVMGGSLWRHGPAGARTLVVSGDSANAVTSVATAPDGTLYYATTGQTFRVPSGGTAEAFGVALKSLTVDASGRLHGIFQERAVVRIAADRTSTAIATLEGPTGERDAVGTALQYGPLQALAIDAAGNAYVGHGNFGADKPGRLWRVDPAGKVSNVFGAREPFVNATDLVADGNGNLYFLSGHGVSRVGAAGQVTAVAGTFQRLPQDTAPLLAYAFAVSPAGDTYTLENVNGAVRLRRLDVDGRRVPTGPDGLGVPLSGLSLATTDTQADLAVTRLVADAEGRVFVGAPKFAWPTVFSGLGPTPLGGALYRVDPDGTVATLAQHAPSSGSFVPLGLTAGPAGAVYWIEASDGFVYRRQADGTTQRIGNGPVPGDVSRFQPQFAVSPAGRVWLLAGPSRGEVLVMNDAGGYDTVGLTGVVQPGGFVPAYLPTFLAAPVAAPDGNLYVLDDGKLLQVAPQGRVTVLAGADAPGAGGVPVALGPLPGGLGSPTGLQWGPGGVLYVLGPGAILRVRLR